MVFADCLLALERRLQEQHPRQDTIKVHKQVLKTLSKNVEGCRDGSANSHMN